MKFYSYIEEKKEDKEIDIHEVYNLDSFKKLLDMGFRRVAPFQSYVKNVWDRDVKRVQFSKSNKPIFRIEHPLARKTRYDSIMSLQLAKGGAIYIMYQRKESPERIGVDKLNITSGPCDSIEKIDSKLKYLIKYLSQHPELSHQPKQIKEDKPYETKDVFALDSFKEILRLGLRYYSSPRQQKNGTLVFRHPRYQTATHRTEYIITKSGYIRKYYKYFRNGEWRTPGISPELNARHETARMQVHSIDDMDELLKFFAKWYKDNIRSETAGIE